MKKICLVIPYFGKWPDWFGFYLKSCEFNPTINWLIYTDCKTPKNPPKNVRFISANIEDFNKLASDKLKLKINIKNAYKLCDFKPACGIIFEDYLKSYDFWGHSDIDVVYGNIRRFITGKILSSYDVITSMKKRTAGHFTLYKNTKKINEIFKKEQKYKLIFTSEANYVFDEEKRIKLRIICKKPPKYRTLEVKGMRGLVEELADKKYLKVYSNEVIAQGRNPFKKFRIIFDKGRLFEEGDDKEFLYFHMHRLKNSIFCEEGKEIPDVFYITNKEIFYNKKIGATKKIIRIIKILKATLITKLDFILKFWGTYLWGKHPQLYYELKKKLKYKNGKD